MLAFNNTFYIIIFLCFSYSFSLYFIFFWYEFWININQLGLNLVHLSWLLGSVDLSYLFAFSFFAMLYVLTFWVIPGGKLNVSKFVVRLHQFYVLSFARKEICGCVSWTSLSHTCLSHFCLWPHCIHFLWYYYSLVWYSKNIYTFYHHTFFVLPIINTCLFLKVYFVFLVQC